MGMYLLSYFCAILTSSHTCSYLHRLPTIHDMYSPNVDCFGRDKHADYRDDMGGVGSFMRQNLTLYVGRIHVTDDIEEVVARHFSEWGEVERIRILNARGIAFVTYMNEANAQFAKEAMAHQSLDHNEILNIRWATQDPNPLAMAREKRRLEEQAAEAIRRALPEEFIAELEGRDDGEAKRKRLTDGTFGLPGYEAPDEIWYNRDKLVSAPEPKLLQQSVDADEKELFNNDTLERLKALKSGGAKAKPVVTPVPVKPQEKSGGGLLGGDYGSDEDED